MIQTKYAPEEISGSLLSPVDVSRPVSVPGTVATNRSSAVPDEVQHGLAPAMATVSELNKLPLTNYRLAGLSCGHPTGIIGRSRGTPVLVPGQLSTHGSSPPEPND